jgi:hypothetical protein
VQALIQKRIAGHGLGSPKPTRLPWIVRLLERTTLPCRLRNRVIPVGIRPEHVRTPDVSLAQAGPAIHNPKCERSNAG